MLELRKVVTVMSGVAVREVSGAPARFVRMADLSELKGGREPRLAKGQAPEVARALAIEEGDLVVSARGDATDVCVAAEAVIGAFVSLDLYLVRPDTKKVDPHFLAAFLNLPSTQAVLSSAKQGTGLARLPKEALETLHVPLPPFQKQRLIGQLAMAFESEERLLARLSALNAVLADATLEHAIKSSSVTDQTKGDFE